ncbi:Por secretion system C-terminal sorting domain-containing protein [Arachidicoccus rhizosphaerae]|uniref:Por secretion system C-terminal sorting domain-containing protein n=1 Tax=Arachidicoccus rhizosphaerae TaxID=551991 RepID=A0A1H3VP51_9BACT|nr:T9SS type A sorting domain-containing protein [Arachidicoccus rhizosphaerae]SDZ76550.1 Por secretion system C-terminal sorting domain-containing protein [Arachidicoccus rhizosphaerae]
MKQTLLLFICFLFTCTGYVLAQANGDGTHTFYVATNGNDNNTGTIDAPLATLMGAESKVTPGDTVFIRGGTYTIPADGTPAHMDGSSNLYYDYNYFAQKGTATKNICYWGYKNERPVFDFSNYKPADHRITAFLVTGNYYYFKNFDVVGVQVTITTHTQSECFRNASANHNIYENLAMHDGQAIGFYLTQGIGNYIHNCDAYNNLDYTSNDGTPGGNVDGFGCHPSSSGGVDNVFRGCRAWFNSDDGFDLINAFAAVTFDSCWAFWNGYSSAMVSEGDGNGFKAGGFGMGADPNTPNSIPTHVVEQCLTYYNKQNGFYANHHLGGDKFLNNTAYRNNRNYNMVNRASVADAVDVDGYNHVLQNNISYSPRTAGADLVNLDAATSTNTNNSFSIPLEADDDDFNSLDPAELSLPRQADGSLPIISFLTLKSNKFIDQGVDVGLSFTGASPDLGYAEAAAGSTLPVTYIRPLKASLINNTAVLSWQTALELNNKGFCIQRSLNGALDWDSVGFVPTVVEAGTGTGASYTFKDGPLIKNEVFYRLKQLNFSGTPSYSSLATIKATGLLGQTEKIVIYPSPVNKGGSVHVKLDKALGSDLKISVYNLSGQLINQDQLNAGNLQYDLSLQTLNSGIYIFKFITGQKLLESKKLVIK